MLYSRFDFMRITYRSSAIYSTKYGQKNKIDLQIIANEPLAIVWSVRITGKNGQTKIVTSP